MQVGPIEKCKCLLFRQRFSYEKSRIQNLSRAFLEPEGKVSDVKLRASKIEKDEPESNPLRQRRKSFRGRSIRLVVYPRGNRCLKGPNTALWKKKNRDVDTRSHASSSAADVLCAGSVLFFRIFVSSCSPNVKNFTTRLSCLCTVTTRELTENMR